MIEQTEQDKQFEVDLLKKERVLRYSEFSDFIHRPSIKGDRRRWQEWFERFVDQVPASWARVWWEVTEDLEKASDAGAQLSQTLIDAAVTYPNDHAPGSVAKYQKLDIIQQALAFKNSYFSKYRFTTNRSFIAHFRRNREYWQPQLNRGRTMVDLQKAWLLSAEIKELEDGYVLDKIRHTSRIGSYVQGYPSEVVKDWQNDFDQFIDNLGASSAELAVNAVTKLADVHSRGQDIVDPKTGRIKWDHSTNQVRAFGNLDIFRWLYRTVPVVMAVKQYTSGSVTENKLTQIHAAREIQAMKTLGTNGLMQGSWPKAGDFVLIWHNDPTKDDASEYFRDRQFNQQEFDYFKANPRQLPHYFVTREYIPSQYLQYIPSRFIDMLNQTKADHLNNYVGEKPTILGTDTKAEDLGNGSALAKFDYMAAKPFFDALETRVESRRSKHFASFLKS